MGVPGTSHTWKVHPCRERGCKERLKVGDGSNFCDAHKDTCKAEGCTNVKVHADGYCNRHHEARPILSMRKEAREKKAAEEREREHELAQRLVRKTRLREKHIDALLAKQGGRCAKSFVTCEIVGNGYATHCCQWGDKPLRKAAADVDHIVPLADGGTDDEDNLQVLCKCCHGLKTEAETHARKLKRTREEARAAEEAQAKRGMKV